MKQERRDELRAWFAAPEKLLLVGFAVPVPVDELRALLDADERLEKLVATIRGGMTLVRNFKRDELTEYGKGELDKEIEVLAYVDQYAPATPEEEPKPEPQGGAE